MRAQPRGGESPNTRQQAFAACRRANEAFFIDAARAEMTEWLDGAELALGGG